MCKSLSKWHFDVENDKLVDLVLEGKKTAYVDIYNGEKEELNSESILIYDNEKSACITKTIKTIICKFRDIEWNLAKLEGIGNSLEEWKEKRYNYFKSVSPNFNDNTLVLVKIFEVTKNLKEERLSLGKLIAENNIEILGNILTISEINAGFNNTIFDVNDKYIIKVCGNKDYENLFDVENNFYNEYKTKSFIPKLYKYDKSKIIVPFVYEIIEKIDGKSIYYYWYKWNEIERENFIKNLVECLNSIHVHKSVNDDWKNKIKNEVINNFNKCSEFFSEKEKTMIKKSFDLYDYILNDNYYSLIHNDLHFDNIFLDKNNQIKIIDFNDSLVAPFDYDYRILFMCEEKPWKWANIEMDPYQKPEDYKNIKLYIRRYCDKLGKIKYLDERMYIYEILDDMRNLPKYKLKEQVDNIVEKSKRILDMFKEV